MTDIVTGRSLANSLLTRLKKRLASRRARLSIVQVGENPASLKFVQEKEKACAEIGFEFELIILPLAVSQEKAEDTVRLLAKNPDVSGIVVQLPLPNALDAHAIV